MEGEDQDQKYLAGLAVGRAQHRVEIPKKEGDRETEADSHEYPIEDVDGRPADERHRNPYEVGVTVQRPAFEQVRTLRAKVAEREVERNGYEEGVTVDEARGT